jgi:hypothetical protein
MQARRVQAELRATASAMAAGELPWSDLEVLGTRAWRFVARPDAFDESLEVLDHAGVARRPGRELRAALEELGCPGVSFEVRFPPDYPLAPVFLRVLSPLFAPRTGHVTAGGAICSKLLTADGWAPGMQLAALLQSVVHEMTACGYGHSEVGPTGPACAVAGGTYRLEDAASAYRCFARAHGWRAAALDHLALPDDAEGAAWERASASAQQAPPAAPAKAPRGPPDARADAARADAARADAARMDAAHRAFLRSTLEALVPGASAVLPRGDGADGGADGGAMRLSLVPEGDPARATVLARLAETAPLTQGLLVLRVHNSRSHIRFLEYCLEIARRRKNNNGGPAQQPPPQTAAAGVCALGVALLFHGAKTGDNTADILRHGFDFRLASMGMSGTGTYFATDASYSIKTFAADISTALWLPGELPADALTTVGKRTCILVARVALGNVCRLANSRDTRRPPEGFDSVASCERNFVVFDNRAAMPEFLILL